MALTVLLNVSGMTTPIINLDSIEEEQEDADHGENYVADIKEVFEISYKDKIYEKNDSHDQINIFIQGEFPSNNFPIEGRHEQLDEKEIMGVSQCLYNDKSASYINKRDVINDQYKTIKNKYIEIDDSDNHQWRVIMKMICLLI